MRVTGERGSALMLVPAGFLVLIVLAAITVDSAAAYLAQRHLDDALTSAANDAAVAGLAPARFYRSGAVALDPAATGAALCRSLAAQADPDLAHLHLEVGIDGARLEVSATARVATVFARALPGIGTRTVAASVTAEAETAPTAAASTPVAAVALRC